MELCVPFSLSLSLGVFCFLLLLLTNSSQHHVVGLLVLVPQLLVLISFISCYYLILLYCDLTLFHSSVSS